MFCTHRGDGVGWGGACNNVHVNLRRKDMLLCKFSGTFHSCVMPRYVSSLELSTYTSCYVTVSSLELSTHASCHAIVSSLELSTHTSCYVTVSSLELSTHASTFHVFMWCWRCTLNNPDPQRFLEELEALL